MLEEVTVHDDNAIQQSDSKLLSNLIQKVFFFVQRNKEKQIDNGFCCWWGGVRLILSICGIVNQRAYQTHVFHVLHILVYDFNGRVEKRTDTSRHTPHDTASQIQINFVRGCKSFLKFSFLIQCCFMRCAIQKWWPFCLSCQICEKGTHRHVRLTDTFSKTILSQKILLKIEELH